MKTMACAAALAIFAFLTATYAEDAFGPKLTPRLKDLLANEMQSGGPRMDSDGMGLAR